MWQSKYLSMPFLLISKGCVAFNVNTSFAMVIFRMPFKVLANYESFVRVHLTCGKNARLQIIIQIFLNGNVEAYFVKLFYIKSSWIL